MSGELHELGALALAAKIRGREVSPVELVDYCLARVAAHNGTLSAFVTVTAEEARAEAKRAERQLLAAAPEDLPPLFGVPTAIKDLTATAGVRTTFGSQVFGDFVPEHDAHVVTLLKKAGTISLGKTNTPEFGLSANTDNEVFGPTRNPWDIGRTAGGSSGG
ncbi:MAG: amidase, partial [Actinomycetota bacterium]|nr:amidase [Actinomycetota bacterium]